MFYGVNGKGIHNKVYIFNNLKTEFFIDIFETLWIVTFFESASEDLSQCDCLKDRLKRSRISRCSDVFKVEL